MRRFATLVVACAIAMLGASNALAEDTSGPTSVESGAQPIFQSDAEAAAQDLAAAAAAHGWSKDQAIAYTIAEAAIGKVAETVAAERPEVFVGSAIADNPSEPPVLFVKGISDEYVRGLVASAGIPIDIRDGQPLSYAELQERTTLINDSLLESGYTDVSSLYDLYAGGVIDVEVVATPGLADDPADVARLLPADVRNAVRITVLPGVQGGPDGLFGGMRTRDDGTNVCTTGFTVERISTGLRGVASAGHCGIFVNEAVHPGHGTHQIDHYTSYVGSLGDFQWFTSGQVETDDFYSDTDTIRDVTAVELQSGLSQNEAVCAYGRSSNDADCSLRISNVNVNCGPTPGNQVRMNGDTQIPGDSGGPWYWGTVAYGLHRGGCGTSGNDHFSVAALVDNAIVAQVVTTN